MFYGKLYYVYNWKLGMKLNGDIVHSAIFKWNKVSLKNGVEPQIKK